MIDLTAKTETQLRKRIENARTELRRRTIVDDPFKAIKGQEHCKRALIVAAVQGHTVILFGAPGSGKSMLVAAGRTVGVPVIEGTPCPCGNYSDPGLPCRCSSTAITRHCRKLRKLGENASLHVECPRVPSSELLSKRHGTTTVQVRQQLDRVGTLPNKDKLGTGCDTIIKQTMSELGLSAKTIDLCLSVAQSIAALGQHDMIQIDDVLEAIHYRRLDRICL